MKKFIPAILALALLFTFEKKATAGSFDTFKWCLKKFEKSIKYEAQSASWKRKRSGWLAALRRARPGQHMTNRLLIELETSVKWSMQSNYWKSRRSAWLSAVRRARYIRQLAPLLLEVEKLAKWKAHYPWWRSARNGWRARVRSLR